MHELHIENTKQLLEFCDRIRHSRWLAMDTEFMREKTYYPRFCLLQLCNGVVAASVDPLTLENLDPLLDIIYDRSIIKILHAGRQDLEIFYHLWKKLPAPLFDTQLAATLTGHGDQVGYGNLVDSVLGRSLEKGHTRTDWSHRPLNKSQLRYALDDVIYLGELFLKLNSRLQALHRDRWLDDDFSILVNPDTYANAPKDTWQRIKGRQKLKGAQLAILQALAAWRESKAMDADLPRRWILKDEVLLEMARRQPHDTDTLLRIRGLDANVVKSSAPDLLKLIDTAASLPKSQWPREENTPPNLSQNQEALADLLMCGLRLQAEAQKIATGAICNRRELEELINGNRDLSVLRGWRKALVGEVLLGILDGSNMPCLENGRLVIKAIAAPTENSSMHEKK